MNAIPVLSVCSRNLARRALQLSLIAGFCLAAVGLFADTKLISNGSPARILVPADGSLGGTWRNRSFDDSSWLAGQNGVGYEVNPGAFTATVIADSQAEWSTAGRQGENSWINGYYDLANDTDGTYQETDFQPFPRSEGPFGPDNFWDGSAWDWFSGNPPWDFIAAADVHPNGVNQPQGIHWVIRRWVSTTSGDVSVRFHVRKANGSGTGVTGKIFQNGVEIFSRSIPGSDQTGFEVYVNTTAAVGDVFDFAHTPEGPNGDQADGSDGSVLTATVLSGTIMAPVEPVGVADSVADWSSTGVQGASGWFYGYYNRTADGDGAYDPNTDFNMTDPNWTFMGGTWQLGVDGNPGANPPWDSIGQSSWHPNGDNQPQGIHWVIRRWVSDVDGDLHARVRFAKANTSGNGTTLHVLHNGVEVFSQTLNNTAGIDVFIPFPGVFVGDRIEFALDPLGTDGLLGDGSDSSTFSTTIFTGPAPQSEVANSVTDWGSAAQGENGWFYGYYNETADADGTYSPGSDFNNTDPNWTFQGGSWQLGADGDPAANPPWDTIGQTEWHPNGDNQPQGVHWVIKRWVSDVDGDLHAQVQFGKQNVNSGNGTTLRVLHNGTEVFSHTVAFNDGTGIDTAIPLPDVFVGDTIEFALDPLGTDGGKGDGADGSFVRASILTGLPPQPFVPGIADCFMTDIESEMRGVNSSVFIRFPFDVSDPAAIETLKLKIKYNDGFAAYLNGTEIEKRNAPTVLPAMVVADSVADWSTNPDVTVNGWEYGYYNESLDADGMYSGGDFTPFPHDGGGHSATDFWSGNGYDWFMGNPPWTELFQEDTHPAAPNGAAFDPNNPATHIHWTIRRWNATVDANLKARIQFHKNNVNGGDGVRVSVFHNSIEVYSQSIAFNDGVGRDDTVDLPDVFIGDTIDILLGPGDAGNDGSDGSAFSMVIFEGEPSIPWDGAATASRTATETIAPQVFDVSSFISQLMPGPNVLAIQGFAESVDDNEFVINAELLANQVPTAVGDNLMALPDMSATYPSSVLLANDSDPDGDALLLVGVTPSFMTAQGGTVRLFGDNVHYTPPAGFTGTDTFEYTITDLSGIPVRAPVSVAVEAFPVNNPPSFDLAGSNVDQTTAGLRVIPDWATNISPGPEPHEAGQTVTFQVSNNRPDLFDVQPDINPAGTLMFSAPLGAMGVATVTVSAMDDGGTEMGGVDTSAPQTFTITLNIPLVCPTAQPQSVSVEQDASVTINLTASDADGATFSIGTPPANGNLSGTPPAVEYTPNAGYCGPDSFTFSVNRAGCPASTATVTIDVICANECPVARANVVPPFWNSARTMTFEVMLDGARERPNPVVTDGVGMGTFTLQNNILSFEIDYAGLSAPVTAAHIHGPATTEQAAGVILGLIPEFGSAGGTEGTISGSVAISDELVDRMAAGLTYVNIHSTSHPAGEIRGQVTLISRERSFTVISPDNAGADVLFDGTQSSDPDGDALNYAWFEWSPPPGMPVQFGDAVVAMRFLAVGQHTIVLEVSDGQCTASDQILVRVILASEAVEELIMRVQDSDVARKNKRPFIATLKAAAASLDRGNLNSAFGQLNAFRNKVRAQIQRTDPDVAAEWIQIADSLMQAVNGQ